MLAFERLIICMLISLVLFKSIYSGKFGAAFQALMFFQTEIMFAFDVIEKVTFFSETLCAFVAFVCFNSRRRIVFIKPHACLILSYRTIINGIILTFITIWQGLYIIDVFILFWICVLNILA